MVLIHLLISWLRTILSYWKDYSRSNNMDMLVYILRLILLMITVIIILALRAEDKKSRSLSNVKEKIVTFRNEAAQTMKRVQETCHDSIDKIQAEQDEANHMISDINLSLENLKNHR